MIREKKITLIDVPQGYYLAHFTNSDFDLRAGVSNQINKAFGMELKLGAKRELYYSIGLGKFGLVGAAIPIDNVFNLIVADKQGDGTTYGRLTTALIDMKEYMDEHFITKVAIPKFIGDDNRLEWDLVLKLITNLFSESKYDVLICPSSPPSECAKEKIVARVSSDGVPIVIHHVRDKDEFCSFKAGDSIFDIVDRALTALERWHQ